MLTLLAVLLCWIPRALHADDHDVVINEIMYHPPSGHDELQFIELFNRGPAEVLLSKWHFSKGVKFTFPEGTRLAANSFLVVCRDPNAFAAHYGRLAQVLGPLEGKLSHKGERLELVNAQGQLIESVHYADSAGWPRGADGYSSSLERISPFEASDLPENWSASAWPATKRAAGTPGQANDVLSTNLPPSIAKVEFSPKTPSPQEPVKVTAQVADTDGVRSVHLLYQLVGTGRQSDEKSIEMIRRSGDAKAGLYEAAISPQAQGQLVRFRVQATDLAGKERFDPSPNEPRPTYSFFSAGNSAKATIPQGYIVNVARPERGPEHYQQKPTGRPSATTELRGRAAFLYIPADGGEPETFDYVRVIGRHGGYKVHFQKDRTLKEMSGINLISEGSLRWILAEPLAYVVYRMAGVPAPLTEHVRVSIDGRLLGFHLLVEQPNKEFLVRNNRDDSGNLYKLIWYGQGVIGQHEKKTHPSTGHADLQQLINGLRTKTGADQWAFIEQNFNVEECVNYYAVNMCIQNWDGFFNNYFTYHDIKGTGKWEIYPWDEDKTWGDYDGASSRYDWYEMPLTFGMNGDSSPRSYRMFNSGPFGGVSWWRPPGYFSGPLLANPEFRRRFLARLRELCTAVFTEENFNPIITAMQQRLEPEVRLRAQVLGINPQEAVREFTGDMQSFRNQVQNRRKFILTQLGKAR